MKATPLDAFEKRNKNTERKGKKKEKHRIKIEISTLICIELI